MTDPALPRATDVRPSLPALAATLRPALHRYCARLTGSVIDGEDVVQDTFVRALAAWPGLDPDTPLRPWLFRIAHNRALDVLRARAVRQGDAAADGEDPDVADPSAPDPLEALARRQAVRTAVSCFLELPVPQRSVLILKDVLDESLIEIGALLDLSVDAVKGHLARGRARLRALDGRDRPATAVPPPSADLLGFVALFDRQDWDGLRALLAEDVKLNQASFPLRIGAADVGLFFGIYARSPAVRLFPVWLEGREAILVQETGDRPGPDYLMWLEWRDGRLVFIHDHRHARYVAADAEWRWPVDVAIGPSDRP